MKREFKIIRSDGSILSVEDYLESESAQVDIVQALKSERGEMKNSSEKPEYLKYANKMGFNWEPMSSAGFIQYDYKAQLILNLIKEYARDLVNRIGFPIYEVSGSNFFDMQYPVVQSYAGLFGERLFHVKDMNKDLVMSYDASYPQFNLAKKHQLSESKLPMAHFSISDCYRYEQSGECMLLFRGRRFNMPDLHPYLKSIDEAWEWYFKIEELIEEAANDVGRKYINVAKVSSMKYWNKYKSQISQIAVKGQKDMIVDIRIGEPEKYWIVDIDYSFIDKLGQLREIGCIQIDIGNAKRLGIKYIDSDGNSKHPVIIHSAVPGGLERYLYMLFDDFDNFPLWLHPIQARLIPVSDKHIEKCKSIARQYKNSLRLDIDDRSIPVNKKVADCHSEYIPNSIVIGDEEVEDNSIWKSKIAKIISDIDESKPYMKFNWPKLLSKRIG